MFRASPVLLLPTQPNTTFRAIATGTNTWSSAGRNNLIGVPLASMCGFSAAVDTVSATEDGVAATVALYDRHLLTQITPGRYALVLHIRLGYSCDKTSKSARRRTKWVVLALS